MDQHRIKLGSGAKTFERGVVAVNRWKMFEIGWVELCYPSTPAEPGAVIAVVAYHFGFWSLHACRVVYTVGESTPFVRSGFAYGTLSDHAESGEELFTVEWNPIDDSVWFSIFAFSRPNQVLSSAAYPITRMLQKRFARDAQNAMVRAVQD